MAAFGLTVNLELRPIDNVQSFVMVNLFWMESFAEKTRPAWEVLASLRMLHDRRLLKTQNLER